MRGGQSAVAVVFFFFARPALRLAVSALTRGEALDQKREAVRARLDLRLFLTDAPHLLSPLEIPLVELVLTGALVDVGLQSCIRILRGFSCQDI